MEVLDCGRTELHVLSCSCAALLGCHELGLTLSQAGLLLKLLVSAFGNACRYRIWLCDVFGSGPGCVLGSVGELRASVGSVWRNGRRGAAMDWSNMLSGKLQVC